MRAEQPTELADAPRPVGMILQRIAFEVIDVVTTAECGPTPDGLFEERGVGVGHEGLAVRPDHPVEGLAGLVGCRLLSPGASTASLKDPHRFLRPLRGTGNLPVLFLRLVGKVSRPTSPRLISRRTGPCPVPLHRGDLNQFIAHLAKEKGVAASTQNQALSAILFLYRQVLRVELNEKIIIPIRATQRRRVPTVLSDQEAKRVIAKMDGIYKVLAQLMYGSGLRLMETLRLRVKDIDFANHQIVS